MLKNWKIAVVAVSAVILLVTGITVGVKFSSGGKKSTAVVLQLLRSEGMNFLVTRKMQSTVIVERDENNLLLGVRHGLLIAEVELLYGFDLNKMEAAAISKRDGVFYVKLPPVELLKTVVDLSSMRFFTKQSNLSVLADKLKNADLRSELQRELGLRAAQQFQRKGLEPTPAEMRDQLKRWAVPFFAAHSIKIAFE